jgi:hypothetical protein
MLKLSFRKWPFARVWRRRGATPEGSYGGNVTWVDAPTSSRLMKNHET